MEKRRHFGSQRRGWCHFHESINGMWNRLNIWWLCRIVYQIRKEILRNCGVHLIGSMLFAWRVVQFYIDALSLSLHNVLPLRFLSTTTRLDVRYSSKRWRIADRHNNVWRYRRTWPSARFGWLNSEGAMSQSSNSLIEIHW